MNVSQTKSLAGPVTTFLENAPAFIEQQFPVGRVSAESFKERTAVQGQLLTTLGSYWKGRKPLVLARAAILGCLLPCSNNHLQDLRIFLLLMGMHDESFSSRLKGIPASKVDPDWPDYLKLVDPNPRPSWRKSLSKKERKDLVTRWLLSLPYDKRVDLCLRPEEVKDSAYLDGIWQEVNAHLGTSANSLEELVSQLGHLRHGRQPRVADTFSGSGSIPFEAARIGCEAFASDLNPVACALTWGAFNVVGATQNQRDMIRQAQEQVVAEVQGEVLRSRFEVDEEGNRAKAFLYCLETRCPKTGWTVPMLGSLVISKARSAVAKLVPDQANKRYDIHIVSGVSAEDMNAAEKGTLRDGRLVHPANPERDGVSIQVIRKDYKDHNRANRNGLRLWTKQDVVPRSDDIFTERLYCIQWITKGTISKARQETFFASVRPEDMLREQAVIELVEKNLSAWQQNGLVPDMEIETGEKTDEPIRTRGWSHWHHFFHPRHLHIFATTRAAANKLSGVPEGAIVIGLLKALDWGNRGCRFGTGAARESISNLFSNQALNTLYNYGVRSAWGLLDHVMLDFGEAPARPITGSVKSHAAVDVVGDFDIVVTDPPYADAVNYQEITEFFISWIKTQPPSAFRDWAWESKRGLAIQGSDEKFRTDMVAAYRAMAAHMPDAGLQVVMFTHQDAGIWADLAAIMWAAGLRVTAAWNVVTETESALKEGNYVQGTILLVLRKRLGGGNAKRMDIEEQIEAEVDRQLAALNALDDDWTSERLYTDGDLQLAAYAAALRAVELHDLIALLAKGTTHVLGKEGSRSWASDTAMGYLTGETPWPEDPTERWGLLRNPLPPASEDPLYRNVRTALDMPDARVDGPRFEDLSRGQRSQVRAEFERLATQSNPIIRRVIRRSRAMLEQAGLLPRIGVVIHPRPEDGLPSALFTKEGLEMGLAFRQAYDAAIRFCALYAKLRPAAGFMKTILLRRIGSSVAAGLATTRALLAGSTAGTALDEEEDLYPSEREKFPLTPDEVATLREVEANLLAVLDRGALDPKIEVILRYLEDGRWLADHGTIAFSQFYDTAEFVGQNLARRFPKQPVAIYAGGGRSFVLQGDERRRTDRNVIKGLVQSGDIKLVSATDAACEGLNLQRLGSQINVDLPWNPSRLEQRKGRVQRIGQPRAEIHVANLRYAGTYEDEVYGALSERFEDIFKVLGQLPDSFEDDWVDAVLRDRSAISMFPSRVALTRPPVERRYWRDIADDAGLDWEGTEKILSSRDIEEFMRKSW